MPGMFGGGKPQRAIVSSRWPSAVEELLEVASASVETRQAELSARSEEKLQGAFQPTAGAEFVKILDIKNLLSAAFVIPERAQKPALRKAGDESKSSSPQVAQQAKLVSFEVNGQEYALPLEAVQEIVPAPSTLAAVPHADEIVLGVANLREELLPLLSLRVLLGFKPANVTGREKVVVTIVGNGLVGLVVDRMCALFSADEARMDPVPDVLAARIGGESRVKAIYRGAKGSNLVSILSPEQLFGDDVMRKLGKAREPVHTMAEHQEQKGASQQFLVFRLGDEEYGLPIGAVEEVARVPDLIARVPKTPKFLEGVINLRGEVLPVVDQRRRFNMPKQEDAAAGRRLVVVRTAHLRAGLIVDSVSEVLRSAATAIEPAPDLTGDASKLVRGIINLESAGRIVLVLDPSELLSRAEQGLLEAFDMGTPGRSDA